MKIRYGFVSNSSSSSFLIALGIVKPEHVAEVSKKLKEINYPCVAKIESAFNLIQEQNWEISVKSEKDKIRVIVEAPVNSMTSLSLLANPEDHILYVVQGNDEGDSDFWNERLQDFEYDKVDLGYFNTTAVEIISTPKYFEKIDKTYGAERNG